MANREMAASPESAQAPCPARKVFDLIGPKWTMTILHTLQVGARPIRFRRLQQAVGSITPKELTKRLRDLERAGLLARTIYAEVPPRVEYSLTDLGRSLMPAMITIHDWAVEHGAAVEASQLSYDLASAGAAAGPGHTV